MRQTSRLAGLALAVVLAAGVASAARSAPTNVIYGTNGDDAITATAAADVIYARSGNDRITNVGSGDVVWGASGDDTILFEPGSVSGAEVHGNVGADVVVGTAVDDSFVNLGGGGDRLVLQGCGNLVRGEGGADTYENDADCATAGGTVVMGDGDDVASVRHALSISLGNGHDLLTTRWPGLVHAGSGNDAVRFDGGGDATVYLVAGNDRLRLNGARNVTAYGNSGGDRVSGDFHDSSIDTEAGPDAFMLLDGSSGNSLNGGANIDVARLAVTSGGTSCARIERVERLDGTPRAC